MDKKSDIRIYKNYIDFKEFQPLKCWKAGLSYGSVIYFEMKDRIFESGLSSYIGSASLWINADYWKIYHAGTLQFDSETISEADILLLNNLFVKKNFLKIEDKRKSLDIFFEDIAIKVFKNQDNSENLITFFLPDGSIFYYSDSFYKSFEIDETRYLFFISQTKTFEIPIIYEHESITSILLQRFIRWVYVSFYRTPDIKREYAQNYEQASQQVCEDYECPKNVS